MGHGSSRGSASSRSRAVDHRPSEPAEVVVTWSRGWAVFALATLTGLAALSFVMAGASESVPARIALAALGLLFAIGSLRQLQLVVTPLRMFAATREGITTYLDGSRYSREGFTVPWSCVVSIERQTRHEQPGNLRIETIAVRVEPSVQIPPGTSYHAGKQDGPVLHLDAMTGSLRGDALLDAMRKAHSLNASWACASPGRGGHEPCARPREPQRS